MADLDDPALECFKKPIATRGKSPHQTSTSAATTLEKLTTNLQKKPEWIVVKKLC